MKFAAIVVIFAIISLAPHEVKLTKFHKNIVFSETQTVDSIEGDTSKIPKSGVDSCGKRIYKWPSTCGRES